MSTEIPTVTLTGTAMVPLVRATAALASEDIPPFAVIGGVAVTVRLGRALRATADLDAVTDQRYTPTALQILRGREDAAGPGLGQSSASSSTSGLVTASARHTTLPPRGCDG